MLINRNNYEEFFLLYVDGELSAGDRIAVEKFSAANPDLQKELNLLKETVLVADNELVFEHKEELYKKEEKKVIGFIWWRVAAAVILLFGAAIWGWTYLNKKDNSKPQVATTTPRFRAEVPPPVPADVKKENSITDDPSAPVIAAGQAKEQPAIKADKPAPKIIEKTIAIEKEEVKLDLPTDLTSTSIEPPKESLAINIVPQKITAERLNEGPDQGEIKAPVYEYVDQADNDIIYVANTSVSKRNKFRGVIRKASRILDRVTSTQ